MTPGADSPGSTPPAAAATAMRALVFRDGQVQLDGRHPRPVAGPNEALVRVTKAVVSDVDVAICRGSIPHAGVLGQQFLGRVEQVGNGGPGDLVGARVVGQATTYCGGCDMCRAGLRLHCRERAVLGMGDRAGCLADYVTLPAGNLVPVPDDVDDDHAVFAFAAGGAVQALRQLRIEGKPYVTIIGDGALAHLTGQLMAARNASVRLLGDDPVALALCEKWGVKHRPIREVGRRADQDVVVVASDSAAGLALATELVRPRGKILLKGAASCAGAAGDLDLSALVLHEIEVIGSGEGPVKEGLALIARHELDVVPLISRRMKLDDGPGLIRTAMQPGIVSVLVDLTARAR